MASHKLPSQYDVQVRTNIDITCKATGVCGEKAKYYNVVLNLDYRYPSWSTSNTRISKYQEVPGTRYLDPGLNTAQYTIRILIYRGFA